MQHHPADQLYIKMSHPQGAAGGFPDQGKSFRQELIQGGPLLQSGSGIRRSFAGKSASASLLESVFQSIDSPQLSVEIS